MNLDLHQLRAFAEVVRSGSFTVAARHLHVSQSAVSHAVQKLAESADAILLERRGRGFALTDDGKLLYESCERIFAELEAAEAALSSGAGRDVQRAVLGATVEFGTTVLIRKMAPFVAEHPEIHLDFHFSHELFLPLLRDEIDVAIDCRRQSHPSLSRIDLFREKYAVIAAPAFVRGKKLKAPRDLSALPILSLDPDGEWWGNLMRALPRHERPSLRHIVGVNHVRGIINAALAGMGVGLVPKYTVLPELEKRSLVELFVDLPLLEDAFCIYQKKTRAERTANRAIASYLAALDTSEFGDAIGRLR